MSRFKGEAIDSLSYVQVNLSFYLRPALVMGRVRH